MFNQYPYLNIQDLNLDYIMKAIKEMRYEVTNFVSINAIKYADPIQWNITTQYEKNTIVIDPVTGTAYISVAPVPAGVALTRPEYWTVVFDLGSFVTRAAQNFTSRWESDTTLTATFPTNTGEWLVWGDVLYKALSNIIAGDTYVVGSNIEHFTIEDLYNAYLNTIAAILAMVGDLQDLTTSDTSDIVHAINSVLSDLNLTIGDLANLNTDDKSSVVNAINDVLTHDISNIVYETADNYNLDNTGATDCAATLAAITDNIGLKAGTYLIDSDCTISAQIVFAKGAILSISSGITVTITGDIVAGRYRIFSGSGSVVGETQIAFPEWFNNDLETCCNSFNHVSLANRDYTMTHDLTLKKSNFIIEGEAYSRYMGAGVQGARIVFTHGRLIIGTLDTVVINQFPTNITVKNFSIAILDGVECVTMYGVVRAVVEGLYLSTVTASRGFGIYRAIGSFINRCYVQVTDMTQPTFYGYYLHDDNSGVRPSSIWITECTFADTGTPSGRSYGYWVDGPISDVFIDKCEVAVASVGIALVNLSTNSYNILINQCDFDAIKETGIQMVSSNGGSVSITGSYTALNSTASGPCMQVINSTTPIIANGLQLISLNTNVIGLQGVGTPQLIGNAMIQGPITPVSIGDTTNVKLDYIANGTIGTIDNNITTLTSAIATNTNNIGVLSNLTTVDKSNLVAAINEVNTP